MKYETKISRKLDYQDVDFTGKMKITKLLDELAYVAHLNSLKYGFWTEDMMGKYGWIVVKQRIKFYQPITISDNYKLATYPGAYSRVKFYRNSYIEIDDQLVMEQTALWSLMDIGKRRITTPKRAGITMPEDTEKRILSEIDNHDLVGDFDHVSSMKVAYSHIDINRHLNNVKYVEWCLDSLDLDLFGAVAINEMNLQYLKESRYGETLHIYSCLTADKYRFKICGADSEDLRFSCVLEVR